MGCGETFESEPDFEGLVDCPNCGMFWDPCREPTPVERLATAGLPEVTD